MVEGHKTQSVQDMEQIQELFKNTYGKPVVTFKNTAPGNHLINVEETTEIETAIQKALSRPESLMQNIEENEENLLFHHALPLGAWSGRRHRLVTV